MRSDYIYDQFHSRGYCIFKNSLPSFNVKKIENSFFFTYSKILGLEVNKKNYSKIILNVEKLKKFYELYLALKNFPSNKELFIFYKFFKKILVNIFKKTKYLFKGYSGIGMNYFIRFKK